MREYRAQFDWVWQTLNKKIRKLAIMLEPYLGLRYKVYSAYLIQNGSNDPVVTVLQNTIGDIVWTRDSTGYYIGTLSGAFPGDKFWATSIGDANLGDWPQIGVNPPNEDQVDIYNYDLWSPGTPLVDDTKMYIEIRVYK